MKVMNSVQVSKFEACRSFERAGNSAIEQDGLQYKCPDLIKRATEGRHWSLYVSFFAVATICTGIKLSRLILSFSFQCALPVQSFDRLKTCRLFKSISSPCHEKTQNEKVSISAQLNLIEVVKQHKAEFSTHSFNARMGC